MTIFHKSVRAAGSDSIRAVFGSDLALVAATHSGSRPALIESGWKNASRVVQGSGAVQSDAISS